MQCDMMLCIVIYFWKGDCIRYVMCCVNATMLILLGLTLVFEGWFAKQEAIQTDRYAKLLIFPRLFKKFCGSEGKQEAILTDRYANPLILLRFFMDFLEGQGQAGSDPSTRSLHSVEEPEEPPPLPLENF